MDGRILFLYLQTCAQAWFGLYMLVCLLISLPVFMFHIAALGALLCAISYLRLPPPDPIDTFRILGPDPRNLDGSPGRRGRGCLGVIARRCAGLDAPENTTSAAKLAKLNGAKCIHFDVTFTSDGVAVVSADSTIPDKPYDQVKLIDVAEGHVLRNKFSPAYIPTVEEMISESLKLGLKMVIEVGGGFSKDSADRISKFVVDLYKKEPRLHEAAIVTSYWPHIIYMIRSSESRIVCALSWRPGILAYKNYSSISRNLCPRNRSSTLVAIAGDYFLSWAFHEFLWYFLGISAVFVAKDVLCPEYIQSWREKGIRLIAFTINNSMERTYLERFLKVSCVSDTLDEITIENVIKDL